jgi:endonuclease/exonuclease/phosphatase family metal-dependent hydrolase
MRRCAHRRIVRELAVDVIGLQEVESRSDSAENAHQLNYLAAQTGLHAIAGPTMVRADAEYGNALLTRHPVLQVRRWDLSVSGREPRGALDVDIAFAQHSVRVITTHLGLRARERHQQVQRLLEVLNDVTRSPTVVLVDVNEWVPASRLLRHLNRRLGKVRAPRTFPARCPVLALDRIWVYPAKVLVAVRVHDTPLARLASDHLPVKARLDPQRCG